LRPSSRLRNTPARYCWQARTTDALTPQVAGPRNRTLQANLSAIAAGVQAWAAYAGLHDAKAPQASPAVQPAEYRSRRMTLVCEHVSGSAEMFHDQMAILARRGLNVIPPETAITLRRRRPEVGQDVEAMGARTRGGRACRCCRAHRSTPVNGVLLVGMDRGTVRGEANTRIARDPHPFPHAFPFPSLDDVFEGGRDASERPMRAFSLNYSKTNNYSP